MQNDHIVDKKPSSRRSPDAATALAKLEALYERRANKVEQLQDFISLFGQRKAHGEELAELAECSEENRALLARCQERVRDFHERLMPLAQEELEESERHQQSGLNLLEAMLEREVQLEQEIRERQERQAQEKAVGCLRHQQQQQQQGVVGGGGGRSVQIMETPQRSDTSVARMLLSDYKNSPFARRTIRHQPSDLQFVDFEAPPISQSLMDSIPAYMRRREKLSDLQQFWDEVVIRCFTQKYALLYKRREAVRGPQLTQWQLYQQQADYHPGQQFITQGDLATQLGKLVCQKTKNRIAMLKHCKLLREKQHKSTVCYLWPS